MSVVGQSRADFATPSRHIIWPLYADFEAGLDGAGLSRFSTEYVCLVLRDSPPQSAQSAMRSISLYPRPTPNLTISVGPPRRHIRL